VGLTGRATVIDDVSKHVEAGGGFYVCDDAIQSEACVPILDDGFVLPESEVIMAYLEERYPEPALLPPDPVARARARLLVHRFDSNIGDDYYAFRRGDANALSDKLEGLEVGESLYSDIAYAPWVLRARDMLGVELAGALKNVIALAAGILEGLGMGHNTRAALITRGLAEITRLGVALGAEPATFAGLAGMGDLILTATGPLSRNHQLGVELGEGKSLEDALAGRAAVVEGVNTARSAVTLAERHGVELPIAREVAEVLFHRKSPGQAVADLMERELKPEHWR